VQPDDFDALVSSLYAASYRAGGWNVALEGLRDAFDLDAFALIRYPNAAAASDQPQVISVGGSHVSESAALRYEEYYGAIDPRTRFVRQHSVQAVFVCEQHFDPAYVSRSEFYQDFLLPEGLRRCMGTCVRLSDQTDFAMGLLRGTDRASFSSQTLLDFQRLIPHFRQALEVHERLSRSDGSALETAMKATSWGVLYLDGDGRYLGGNGLAEALLTDPGVAKIRAGRLVMSDARTQRRFLAALERGRQGPFAETMLIEPVSAGARRLTLTLQAMPADRADRSWLPVSYESNNARLVCILAPLDRRRVPSIRQLMDVFGLAPAEARLAHSLACGEALHDYAISNTLGMSTVRSQLKAVFRKTGTECQSDLVRVLNNIPATRPQSN
jgi:PAS domain-containing protein